MRSIFAEHRSKIDWSVENIFIAIIIVAAVVGIAYLAIQFFEVPVPGVVWKIVSIVLVAALAILAIRFLFTL